MINTISIQPNTYSCLNNNTNCFFLIIHQFSTVSVLSAILSIFVSSLLSLLQTGHNGTLCKNNREKRNSKGRMNWINNKPKWQQKKSQTRMYSMQQNELATTTLRDPPYIIQLNDKFCRNIEEKSKCKHQMDWMNNQLKWQRKKSEKRMYSMWQNVLANIRQNHKLCQNIEAKRQV